jgi:hypothetical protein
LNPALLGYVLSGLELLPRATLAKLAREVLAKLVPQIEAATTNTIAHEAEVVAFGAIDSILAKIENAVS